MGTDFQRTILWVFFGMSLFLLVGPVARLHGQAVDVRHRVGTAGHGAGSRPRLRCRRPPPRRAASSRRPPAPRTRYGFSRASDGRNADCEAAAGRHRDRRRTRDDRSRRRSPDARRAAERRRSRPTGPRADWWGSSPARRTTATAPVVLLEVEPAARLCRADRAWSAPTRHCPTIARRSRWSTGPRTLERRQGRARRDVRRRSRAA